jgi:hypothetical protein
MMMIGMNEVYLTLNSADQNMLMGAGTKTTDNYLEVECRQSMDWNLNKIVKIEKGHSEGIDFVLSRMVVKNN